MACNCVAGVFLLLTLHSFLHQCVSGGRDLSHEFSPLEGVFHGSKQDLQTLIKQDTNVEGSEVDAGGGGREGLIGHMNGAGLTMEEEPTLRRSILALPRKKGMVVRGMRRRGHMKGKRRPRVNRKGRKHGGMKGKGKGRRRNRFFWPVLGSGNGADDSVKDTVDSTPSPVRFPRKGGMHGNGKGMHWRRGGMHGNGKGMHRGKGMHGGMHRSRRPAGVNLAGTRPNTTGYTPDLIVAKDGSGDFTTVQAALDAAPRGTAGRRFIIYVKGGDYVEKCVVRPRKQYLTLVGEKLRTRILWNDSLGRPAGFEWSTNKTGSFNVQADDFMAVDITFVNTFGWPDGRDGAQAVALMVFGDRAQFYGCTFDAHQDTLLSALGRHYFYKCHIIGSVDFVFGAGRGLFEECLIEAINNPLNPYTAIAAQKRPNETDNSGFVFRGGQMKGTGSEFGTYGTILGRTWGPWCTIIYIRVQMDCPVTPEGWNNMARPQNEANSTLLAYGCTGIGVSNTAGWQIGRLATAQEIAKYDGIHYIDGSSWVSIPPWWRQW